MVDRVILSDEVRGGKHPPESAGSAGAGTNREFFATFLWTEPIGHGMVRLAVLFFLFFPLMDGLLPCRIVVLPGGERRRV